jgi:extradiol dioxygenase family protein
MNTSFQNRVHLALPMKSKKETAYFYGELLQLPVIDYSSTELCVDLFDQHIAFHTVPNFFEVKAPLINLTTQNNPSVAVSSFHFGAVIRKSDFDTMVERIQSNHIEVILGPEVYQWPDGKEEYMIQFYDCNHFNLELKANSVDEMYALNDLAKWSHKHLTA